MDQIVSFSDMQLSEKTLQSLSKMKFTKPTKVQLKTIPICLKERDVIVQAKTGSGKTLAFLIPLVEQLYKMKCTMSRGIQSIILVPTAELAIQTVHVLSQIIQFHNEITYLSVIGGKSHSGKKEEWAKINDANIIVSTPGRLLEHLEKNVGVDLSGVRHLIIDETDYMLDDSFIEELEAILKFVPPTRMNWMFSATQCSITKKLGCLGLNNPVHIGMDESIVTLPKNLTQTFMKIELQDKIQALWNILEAQHKANTIVFFSTQKQVLFFHRLFSALSPSYKLVQLRSNMRLDKRSHAIEQLLSSKEGSVLLATDVASRGLDFPNVSLVIHFDLPRELDYYIHRSGRTARYNSRGTSVLMVMPSEMGFMALLKEKGIMLKKTSNNILKSHKKSIAERASIQYSLNVDLYNVAKNSFIAYLRDYSKKPVQLDTDKLSSEIFNVNKLPVKLFAKSMGFTSIPEEYSTMSYDQSTLTLVADVELDDRPILTAKKKTVGSDDKCHKDTKPRLQLDMSDDEEDVENEVTEETLEDEKQEDVPPAFDFEKEFAKMEKSSRAVKRHFREVVKRKYKKVKKSKQNDHEDENKEMEEEDENEEMELDEEDDE